MSQTAALTLTTEFTNIKNTNQKTTLRRFKMRFALRYTECGRRDLDC